MKVSRVNPESSKSKDQVLAIICILFSNPYTFCVSDPPQTYINFKHLFKQNVKQRSAYSYTFYSMDKT